MQDNLCIPDGCRAACHETEEQASSARKRVRREILAKHAQSHIPDTTNEVERDEPCGEDGCEYVGDFLDTSLVLPPSAASSSSSSLITVSAGGRTMPMLLAGPTDCLAVRALSLSLRRTGYTIAQPLRGIVRNKSTHENLGSTRVAYVRHIIEECQGRVKIGQCRRSECHRGTLRSDRTQDDLPHNQRIGCTKRL